VTRALVIVLAVLVGCGDEGTTSNSPPPPPPAGGGPKPAAKPKGKGATLKQLPQIEDRVTEMERPTIRHVMREGDFRPDPLGMDNRDPFRSYVVNQGNLDTGLAPAKQDEGQKCDENAMVAHNYNLRDLRLVGIVTKGVNKYALFQDPADYGHIVRRRECLGREKAKVKDIGSGFVTLEITPEQSASAPPRPTEERSIPLYPNELKLGETDRGRGASPSGVAPPTMPSGGTDPVLPSEPVPSPAPPTTP
jgi:Tfp pilus assembly protein PilP